MLKLFVVFNVVLYGSNAYSYFWSTGVSAIKPLQWYLLTIGAGLVLLLVYRRQVIPSGRPAVLVLWAAAMFFGYSASFVFVSDGGPEALQSLITRAEQLVLLVMFILFFQDKKVLRAATGAMVGVVLTSVLINYFDFITRGAIPLSLVLGRAAGLYLDANISGYVLAIGMLLTTWILPRKLRWLYCAFVGTGVALTFSRSSMLLWTIAVISMAWYGWFMWRRGMSVGMIVVGVVAMAAMLASGQLLDYTSKSEVGRYLDKNTSARIAESFVDQNDESSNDRLHVAARGINAFLAAPVVGHGIGALGPAQWKTAAHNQYIVVAAEFGVVGLLIFLTLVPVLWRNGTDLSRSMAISYSFGCVFLHMLLDLPVMQLALALAVSYAGKPQAAFSPRRDVQGALPATTG